VTAGASALNPREPFAGVPNRAFRAVEAHELNQSEAWVLFWLIYRCGRDGGETAFTLKGLAAESRWGKSAEALRQTLHALQEKQWIDADPPSSRGSQLGGSA
jgi:hypothetical protein